MSADNISNRSNNNAADLMKFFFILGIILFHVHPSFGDPYKDVLARIYKEGGSLGNVFFATVSGFFMSKNYYDRIRGKNGMSFRDYVCKRMASIYPIFFISNVIQLALSLILKKIQVFDVAQFFLSLVFVTGMGGRATPPNYPTWFISDLLICYLLYFLIVKISKTRTGYRTSVIVMILIAYFCKMGVITVIPLIGGFTMAFFLGCIMSEVTESSSKLKWMIYMINLSFALIGVLLSIKWGVGVIASDRGAFYAFIIMAPLVLIADISLVKKLFDNRVIGHIGKLSMPMFFWHAPVHTLFIGLYIRLTGEMNGKLALPIYLVILLIVSEISNLIFPRVNSWFLKVLRNEKEDMKKANDSR